MRGLVVVCALVALGWVTGCAGAAGAGAGSGSGGAPCQVRRSLPDPRCTPGATDPAVTQATVTRTTCAHGRSPARAVSPPAARAALARYRVTRPSVVDRLIPVELGGAAEDPRNLWPLPRTAALGAAQKHQVEAFLRRSVCSGAMPLAAAQDALRHDWLAEYLDSVTG